MDYFDTNIASIQNEDRIKARVHSLDPAFLARLGIHPLVRDIPAYDAAYYAAEPSGGPHPDADGPRYVQDYVVVPLPLEEARAAKAAEIDAETSQTILGGFEYEVDGTACRFSYDAFDQQNFADTANVCMLKLQGVAGLPEAVTWNAYTIPGGELVRPTFDAPAFLALYTGGALAHKNAAMRRGGERKAAVEAAATVEEVVAA